MCPVCTVTVVAGLGISRFFGIDDFLTSIWIGAFVLSFSYVFYAWMIKKWPKTNVKHGLIITTALMYLLALLPLINTPTISRILYGTLVGSITFLIGVWGDKLQRKKYKKIFFPYQKVVFPVACLIIVSIVFYFVL